MIIYPFDTVLTGFLVLLLAVSGYIITYLINRLKKRNDNEST